AEARCMLKLAQPQERLERRLLRDILRLWRRPEQSAAQPRHAGIVTQQQRREGLALARQHQRHQRCIASGIGVMVHRSVCCGWEGKSYPYAGSWALLISALVAYLVVGVLGGAASPPPTPTTGEVWRRPTTLWVPPPDLPNEAISYLCRDQQELGVSVALLTPNSQLLLIKKECRLGVVAYAVAGSPLAQPAF